MPILFERFGESAGEPEKPDLLFTLHCAVPDAEGLIDSIRAISRAPIHIRAENAVVADFDDAGTAERVSGELKRTTIELIVGEDMVPDLLRAVKKHGTICQCVGEPFRCVDQGRIA